MTSAEILRAASTRLREVSVAKIARAGFDDALADWLEAEAADMRPSGVLAATTDAALAAARLLLPAERTEEAQP